MPFHTTAVRNTFALWGGGTVLTIYSITLKMPFYAKEPHLCPVVKVETAAHTFSECHPLTNPHTQLLCHAGKHVVLQHKLGRAGEWQRVPPTHTTHIRHPQNHKNNKHQCCENTSSFLPKCILDLRTLSYKICIVYVGGLRLNCWFPQVCSDRDN